MKIFLIGMPGSGKTTLGKILAERLYTSFVDLDEEIQKREGQTIPAIFRTKGEDHFRETESILLKEWAASADSFVMATGGGAPCFYQGIDIINASGLSIFLDVGIGELLSRLKTDMDRPLLGEALDEKEKALTALREKGSACYEKARIRVENPDIEKVLEALRVIP